MNNKLEFAIKEVEKNPLLWTAIVRYRGAQGGFVNIFCVDDLSDLEDCLQCGPAAACLESVDLFLGDDGSTTYWDAVANAHMRNANGEGSGRVRKRKS